MKWASRIDAFSSSLSSAPDVYKRQGLRQRFRQAHHIPQTEIKALPGDGMQRLRRITDQRQAMGKDVYKRQYPDRRRRAGCRRFCAG